MCIVTCYKGWHTCTMVSRGSEIRAVPRLYILRGFTTSDDAFPFHTPLRSVVPFAYPQISSTHSCMYPILPGSAGTTSFFPSFRFPVDHNFW